MFKYKNIAPVSFEQPITEVEIEKNKTTFSDSVYRAKLIVGQQELYESITNLPSYQSLLCLPQELNESTKPYVISGKMVYELSKGTTPVSVEIRKNNNDEFKIVPLIKNKDKGYYFDFDEDGVMKAFEVLVTGKVSKEMPPEPPAGPTPPEKKSDISENGKLFLETWRNLPIVPTKEELKDLFDFCDEVPEEDFENKEIKEAYEKLCKHPYLNPPKQGDDLMVVSTTRSIFVKADMMNHFKGNQSVEEIIDKMRSLPMGELFKFFKTRRLVYIYGFLKIRIRNTQKERIVFVTGDKIGKNSNDIYIFEYNEHHDFTHLKDCKPENVSYELLCKNVELDGIQTTLAESFHIPYKPLICTGCAGSGKTLISVQMYANIIEEVFSNEKVEELNLIYLTYNQRTVNSVIPLLQEKVSSVNAKTIEEYFVGIIGNETLAGKKIVDEHDFFKWWNEDSLNEITHYKEKNDLLNFKKQTLARYAYTFFRGFFKGSLYRMENDFSVPFLSKSQFTNLIKTKKEPVSDRDIETLFTLFEMYQNHLVKSNLVDDNDLARMVAQKVVNGVANQYERIIIDEVQDLTEVQLDAIIKSSSDKRKLYFFGDQNQSINPTLFDINTIQRCLKANLVNEIVEPQKMNKSYRVGPLLAEYINHLTKLINDKIGASGDPLETSALSNSESRWGYKVQTKSSASHILQQAFLDAKTIVIVPDEIIIDKLVKEYGEGVKERAITIYESKGLEWDRVVMYDMLSFNNQMFEEILNDKAYNSTLHRMIFNQFYVGCTRAHVFFVVVETNISPLVEANMIGNLVEAPEDIISADNSSASWILEGERLFRLGEYKLARNAFNRAEDSKATQLADVCTWMIEENYSEERASYCKDNKLYKEAKAMYIELGQRDLARLMDAYLGAILSEEEIKRIIANATLCSNDMHVLNKNGFFNAKVDNINTVLDRILKQLEENK